ncbi:MAG: thiamine-phosphate kinase [Rhodoluna sp.]|nr:thiamine-phosphate kinase [Rhodoluna sp.]
MSNPETLASLGENEALRRTVSRLKKSENTILGSGDDAAVVRTSNDQFVVTTDTMIEGNDFKTDWSSGFDLGWKAVATNISDVAAMGAKPTALVVALAVPKETEITWLEQFADGLQAAVTHFCPTAEIVGGDLAQAEQIVIAVTAHGDMEGRAPILRTGAKPGDILAVAGTLGQAACGLSLLQSSNPDAISAYDDWVNVQKRPMPPIQSGIEAVNATSMLDISDGLAKDAYRIAKASKVKLVIAKQALDGYCARIDDVADRLEVNSLDWVLFGGEDHSLLATFPEGSVIPRSFKPIGRVEAGDGVFLDSKQLPERGWDSALAN